MMLLLFLWTTFCITHAREHAYYVIIDHSPAVMNRLVIGLMTLTFFIATQLHNPLVTLWIVPITAWMLASVFWVVFDMARNWFSGEAPFYIGGTASIDRWGRKYAMVYYSLKFFMLVGSITMYIQFFHYGFSYLR